MGKYYYDPPDVQYDVEQSAMMRMTSSLPLDDRFVIDSQSDLLEESTWLHNGVRCTYSGMIVGVVNDSNPDNNGAYMLVKSNKYNKQSWDTTASNYNALGWMKISGGSSPIPTPNEIYMDQSITNEEQFPGSFGGSGTQNDPYWVSTINGGNF